MGALINPYKLFQYFFWLWPSLLVTVSRCKSTYLVICKQKEISNTNSVWIITMLKFLDIRLIEVIYETKIVGLYWYGSSQYLYIIQTIILLIQIYLHQYYCTDTNILILIFLFEPIYPIYIYRYGRYWYIGVNMGMGQVYCLIVSSYLKLVHMIIYDYLPEQIMIFAGAYSLDMHIPLFYLFPVISKLVYAYAR